jgi:hypothetical protein
MEKETADVSVFSEKLATSTLPTVVADEELRGRIFELADNPEVVVRVLRPNLEALDLGLRETLRIAKEEYDLLGAQYGVAVSVEYRVGDSLDGAGQAVYGSTERVHEVLSEEHEMRSAQAALIAGLLRYYYHKLDTLDAELGELAPYLNDIAITKQYVYGTTKSNPEPRYHLVDVDYEHVASSVSGIMEVLMELSTDEIGMLQDYVSWAKRAGVSLETVRQPLLAVMRGLETISTQYPQLLPAYRLSILTGRLEQVFGED